MITAFSIMSLALSKTGFSLLLLQVANGKRVAVSLLWFMIISMNLILPFAVLIIWIKCHPVQKVWIPTTPGTCWDDRVHIAINTSIHSTSS